MVDMREASYSRSRLTLSPNSNAPQICSGGRAPPGWPAPHVGRARASPSSWPMQTLTRREAASFTGARLPRAWLALLRTCVALIDTWTLASWRFRYLALKGWKGVVKVERLTRAKAQTKGSQHRPRCTDSTLHGTAVHIETSISNINTNHGPEPRAAVKRERSPTATEHLQSSRHHRRPPMIE